VQVEALIRFSLLQALSTRNDSPETASRPFDATRDGFVMAEGAACLVLESAAQRRGARRPRAGLAARRRRAGGRLPPHPLQPRWLHHRQRHAPRRLPMPGWTPGDIGYVNAHGTSTPENDKMEALGLSALFEGRPPPASSNKSQIGHSVSASGAIEAAFSVLTLRDQRLPPTINHHNPDPAISLDVVPNQARDARVSHILSNSFGFGGQNCLHRRSATSPCGRRTHARLQLFGDRDLRVVDVALPPPPGPGEVQLRMQAIALNHIDVWGWRGMAFAKRELPHQRRRGSGGRGR
jgi:3-oxoacyl-[acyl-carrier-protein] synthase II